MIVTAVLAIGAFVVLRPDDEDPEPATTTTQATDTTTAPERTTPEANPQEPEVDTIRVRDGQAVGGVQTIEVKRGETAHFQVSTETPQEVHLHGYDLEESSTADRPAEFHFEADETGIFEIEIHGTGTQIGELKVEP